MDEEIERILRLESKPEVEAAAHKLTLDQAHVLLNYFQKQTNDEKLLPLLVGMPQNVFYELLSEIEEDEAELLKGAGPTEALQHKLTLLAHDWKNDLESITNIIAQVNTAIQNIKLDNVGKQEILAIKENIDSIDNVLEDRLIILDNALTIAWNTKRIDIIDSLSSLKDLYLRTSSLLIGHQKDSIRSSSGLYKKLDERLNLVYSLREPNQKLIPLSDDEPAIEALTSFGIFYLEDYWELGLLPSIKSLTEIKRSLQNKSHEEKVERLEKLIIYVENTLKEFGLVNVKSLKDAKIYSREMLQEYISNKGCLSQDLFNTT